MGLLWSHDLTMNVDKKGILPRRHVVDISSERNKKKVIIIIIIIICGKDCTKEYQIRGIEKQSH
jgi:hypothetical protein